MAALWWPLRTVDQNEGVGDGDGERRILKATQADEIVSLKASARMMAVRGS